MSKTIKTVETLIERAQANYEKTGKGLAKINRRQRDMWGVGDLQEVYRVETDGQSISLYHYGTLTAKVTNNHIEYVYGRSVSDADSVATFLNKTAQQFGVVYNASYRPSIDRFSVNKVDTDNNYKQTEIFANN